MRNIKLTIEYDGTNFNGWQIQDKSKRTVQGEIEKAIRIIFKKKIRLIGSGRTDSGVHAFGQVANFKTSSSMTPVQITKALNANLPEDVVILKAEDVPQDFHSQYNAKWKLYRYCILHRKVREAQQRHFSHFFPHVLNLAVMRKEAKSLLGKKDFRSFMASDHAIKKTGKTKNSIRTISKLTITKKGDHVYFDIEANGFLYKMVRNIVGTLIAIGNGKLPKGSMLKILKGKNRILAATTAPAKGLCLLKVSY